MVFARRFNALLAHSLLYRALGLPGVFLIAAGLGACQPTDDGDGQTDAPPVVEITAADYAFVAPDTIPAGWVTFRMENRGEESHHFHLDRLPEGWTVAEWQETVKEPADSVVKLLRAGTIDSAEAEKAFNRIGPDSVSAGDVLDAAQTHGGVGLVAPGRTGRTTHHVDPGHYMMICVLGATIGLSHSQHGMIHGLVAVDSSAEGSPPSPDVTVRGDGREIRMDGPFTAGRRAVGFRVEEVPREYRGGTDGYYSVWLARLEDTTDTQDVAAWRFNNPAPYESLGGFEYLPPSDTAYVTADVEPGRYAWIWFYDGMGADDDDPMVKPFTVE
jgi:hypothetical protein